MCVRVSVPKDGTARFEATDGKALCRVDLDVEMARPADVPSGGLLVPIDVWRKVPKLRQGSAGAKARFTITSRGAPGSKDSAVLGWRKRKTMETASEYAVDGSYPDTEVIFKNVTDDILEIGLYDASVIGNALVAAGEVIQGMGREMPFVKVTAYKAGAGGGVAIRASDEGWKLSAVVMGLAKDAKC